MRNISKRGLVILAIALAVLFGAPVAVYAASSQTWTNGNDLAVWDDPYLSVLDRECDGNDAYMSVYRAGSPNYTTRYFDLDGCNGSASNYTINNAIRGMFCETVGGVGGGNDLCGAWKNMQ